MKNSVVCVEISIVIEEHAACVKGIKAYTLGDIFIDHRSNTTILNALS